MQFELSQIGKFHTVFARGEKNHQRYGDFYLEMSAQDIADARILDEVRLVSAECFLDERDLEAFDTRAVKKWGSRSVQLCLSNNFHQNLLDQAQQKSARGLEMALGTFRLFAMDFRDVYDKTKPLIVGDFGVAPKIEFTEAVLPLFPELPLPKAPAALKPRYLSGIQRADLRFY